uniref:Uncharacterized protein n=1 Tax=Medicago truncatula TaxID=3880 RepID=I3S5H1_MEDTR|nr:unknown [Medicago truncatula]
MTLSSVSSSQWGNLVVFKTCFLPLR